MALTQISTAGVKDDAVTAGKIPANAVGSSELADNAVDTAAIADDAVTDAKLANSINTAIAANTAKVQTTINNNADNRVITGSGTANTLNGESSLTFDGTSLNLPNVNQFIKGGGHNIVQVDATRTYLYGGTNGVQFRTADNSAELINITNDGKLGIGVTSPTGSLHVKSDVTTNAYFETTSGSGAYLQLSLGASGAGLGYLGHSNQLCGSPTAGNLALRFEGTALEFAKGSAIKARITNDGLCFGADTAAANALDDYEEGSWTPVFQNNDNGGTFPVSTYIRVGRLVSISFHATVGGGSDTSGFKVTGLPFSPDKNGVAPVATNCNIPCFARIFDSSDRFEVLKFDSTDVTYQNLSDKFIMINATYRCNP